MSDDFDPRRFHRDRLHFRDVLDRNESGVVFRWMLATWSPARILLGLVEALPETHPLREPLHALVLARLPEEEHPIEPRPKDDGMSAHDRARKERAERCDRNDPEALADAIRGLQSTDDPALAPLHDALLLRYNELTRPGPAPELGASPPLKSAAQSTLLRLVAQYGDGGHTWVPRVRPQPLGDVTIDVSGSGAASAWRALVAKGLIEPAPLADYAARITERGRAQARVEAGRPLTWISQW